MDQSVMRRISLSRVGLPPWCPGGIGLCLVVALSVVLTATASVSQGAVGLFPESLQKSGESLPDLTRLSLEELMNLEVTTASKKSQKLADTAAAAFVLTQEDIRRSGATSIPEALRMVPGLNVARIDSNKWAITARGFNDRFSDKLLVLVDGRTVYTPFFAGVYWELQDYVLEDIERIEVIRGPGGSLWGANAVNGIINIITKKASETHGALISAIAGTEEGIGTVRYGGQLGDRLHYRVFGKYFNRDTSEAPGGAHDDWRAGRGGFRMDWTPNSADVVSVHGNYSEGRAGDKITLPRLSAPFGTQSQDEDVGLFSHSLLANWTHKLGADSETRLQLYVDQYRRDSVSLGERVNTYDVDFQHRMGLPFGHEVTWGGGYRLMSDRFRTSAAITMQDSSRDLSLYSGFVQDEIRLMPDRLTLTVGTKLLHNDFTGFEVQPSARLLWKATQGHSLWTAVSRAVRTPDRFRSDATLNVTGTPFGPVQIRNSPIRSERAISYELGYRGQISDRSSVDVATFYSVYDNLVLTNSVSALASQYANNARGHTAGVEVAADWQLFDWWDLRPAFTYQQVVVDGPPRTETIAAAREGSTPDHQLSLRSRMSWGDQWEFDAWYRFVDRLGAVAVPHYHTVDLRLGWRPEKHLRIDLVGQNLFDQAHQEFQTRAGGTQSAEVQRAGYLRVTWTY